MKVSVIIPIYNSQNTINKCVKSVLNQSFKDIELLLINDGSTDDSLSVIRKIKDKRIRIIDKKNEGVSKTRNLGIKVASGDYIMFVDNDDYLDEKCIEEFVNNIKDNDILIGGYKRVTDNKTLFKCKLKDKKWSKYIVMAPWAKLYNREFLLKNKIEFFDYKIGEDVYFNLQAINKTNKINTIPSISYNWYYNESSVSNTIQKGLNEEIDINKLLNNIIAIDNFYDNELNIYYIKRYIIWYLLFSGKNSSSKRFISEYDDLKKWKKEKNIKTKIGPLSRKISGESFKNRMTVLVFGILEKLHLLGIFSKIYCKGKD